MLIGAGFLGGSRPFCHFGGNVATFTCPHCKRDTDYDTFHSAYQGQQEEHDGKPYWCLYVLVICSHCGQTEKVLWKRDEIKP